MKRLIDRLLSRWYVPCALYERERRAGRRWRSAAMRRLRLLSECETGPEHCEPHNIIVTTDYNRGCPCS